MGLELANAYIAVRGDTGQFARDVQAGQGQMVGVVAGLANQIKAAIAGIGFAALGRQALNLAGQAEQLQISLEVMLGSADEAAEMIKKMKEFAAKTPFELNGVAQAARGLIQFGERGDDVFKTMEALGNAAAGTSSDYGMLALIFNQVRGVGKLLTQDFRQLSTRGVLSLQDIADHFGVTTGAAQEMLSKGKISFEDLRDILFALSGEGGRFENLMERQSASFLGMMSTLKDGFDEILRIVGASLVPLVKPIVDVGIKLTGLFEIINNKTGGAVGALAGLAGGFVGVAVAIQLMKTFGLAQFFANAASTAKGLTTAMFGFVKSLWTARISVQALSATIKGALISTGYGALIVAIGLVIAGLVKFVQMIAQSSVWTERGAGVAAKFREAWERVKMAFQTIGEAIVKWLRSIMEAMGVDFQSAADDVAGTLIEMADWVADFVLHAAKLFQLFAEQPDKAWGIVAQSLKTALSYMWDMTKAFLYGLGKAFLDATAAIGSAMIEFFKNMTPGGKSPGEAFAEEFGREFNLFENFDFGMSNATKKMASDLVAMTTEAFAGLKGIEDAAGLALEKKAEDAAAAMADATKSILGQLDQGRVGFKELGTKVQDMLIKGEKGAGGVDEKILGEEKKAVGLLGDIRMGITELSKKQQASFFTA